MVNKTPSAQNGNGGQAKVSKSLENFFKSLKLSHRSEKVLAKTQKAAKEGLRTENDDYDDLKYALEDLDRDVYKMVAPLLLKPSQQDARFREARRTEDESLQFPYEEVKERSQREEVSPSVAEATEEGEEFEFGFEEGEAISGEGEGIEEDELSLESEIERDLKIYKRTLVLPEETEEQKERKKGRRLKQLLKEVEELEKEKRALEKAQLKSYKEKYKYKPPLKKDMNTYMEKTREIRASEDLKTQPRDKRFRQTAELDPYREHIFALNIDEEEQREKMLLRKEQEERKREVKKLTKNFMDWVTSIEPPVPDAPLCIDEDTITKMFSIGEDSLQIRLRIPVFVHELRPVPTQLASAVNLEQPTPTLQYLLEDREAISRKAKKNKFGHQAWNIPVSKWFTKWNPEYGYQEKPEDMSISFTEIHGLLSNLRNPTDLENLRFD